MADNNRSPRQSWRVKAKIERGCPSIARSSNLRLRDGVGFLMAAFMVALFVATGSGAVPVEAATEEPARQAGPINPHSDLIFRATGATSCRDCHRTDRTGRLTERLDENAIIQALRDKAKGIHGPGRFADCLRCHAGGDKGVEQYRR